MDLEKTLIRRGRKGRVSVDMPSFSLAFESDLYRIYSRVISAWSKQVAKDIVAEYKRELATRDSPEAILSSIDARMVQLLLTFRRQFEAWAQSGARIHYRALIRKLKYSTGIDLSDILSAGGKSQTIEDLLRWNTELIRNITEDTRNRISSAVYSGFTARTPPEVISREIANATGMARARARRIASDQTVKLSSALDNDRMHELGATGYEWMHSGKVHYRPEHQARSGDFVKFGSDIDKTDPPGYAPFCGCKRRMVLELGE